jgi:glutamyl-tRNA synthetase
MSGKLSNEVMDVIVKLTLKNAIEHDGKALVKVVLSKLLGSFPELRPQVKELEGIVSEVVSRINSMSLDEQVRLAKERYPEIFEEREAVPKVKTLPPLPNVEKYKEVRTRFAPNP